MPPKRQAIGRPTPQARMKRALRPSESDEQRPLRLENLQVQTAETRSHESLKQREVRLETDRMRTTQARSPESSATRRRLSADNNTALIEDAKWFFRGISKIAGTVEQMLPNVTTNEMRTRSFSENTKLTFLMGLRHLLVGVREISMTFEQSFNTDHIKQLQQLKNATNFINDLLNDLKMWFSQIRALVMHLVHLYNRYIPEVLFGKCVGIYLISNYPERSFYEYPFILLTEIYSSMVTAISDATITKTSSDTSILDTDLNVEQNEIQHSDSDDYRNSYGRSSSSSSSSQLDKATSQAESFFDFSSVVSENKDKLIDSAVNQHSWQICLKMYTAESISRSLKTYFLGL